MGNCCPCWRVENSSYSYEKVSDEIADLDRRKSMEVPSSSARAAAGGEGYQQQRFSNQSNLSTQSQIQQGQSNNIELPVQNSSTSARVSLSFDLNALPFKGCEVQQKFNNNQSYQKRFVWLNYETKTIHMSQHMTKERRHKEASLCDVTSVVAGPPVKKKSQFNDSNSDYCLTVNFKRGGGIDLLFKSKEDRDSWYSTLLNIVAEIDKTKV